MSDHVPLPVAYGGEFPTDRRMKNRGGVVYVDPVPHLDGCQEVQERGGSCGRRCLCTCHERPGPRRALLSGA